MFGAVLARPLGDDDDLAPWEQLAGGAVLARGRLEAGRVEVCHRYIVALGHGVEVEQLHPGRRNLKEAAAQLDRHHLTTENEHAKACKSRGEHGRALRRLAAPIEDRLEQRRSVELPSHAVLGEEAGKGRRVICGMQSARRESDHSARHQ